MKQLNIFILALMCLPSLVFGDPNEGNFDFNFDRSIRVLRTGEQELGSLGASGWRSPYLLEASDPEDYTSIFQNPSYDLGLPDFSSRLSALPVFLSTPPLSPEQQNLRRVYSSSQCDLSSGPESVQAGQAINSYCQYLAGDRNACSSLGQSAAQSCRVDCAINQAQETEILSEMRGLAQAQKIEACRDRVNNLVTSYPPLSAPADLVDASLSQTAASVAEVERARRQLHTSMLSGDNVSSCGSEASNSCDSFAGTALRAETFTELASVFSSDYLNSRRGFLSFITGRRNNCNDCMRNRYQALAGIDGQSGDDYDEQISNLKNQAVIGLAARKANEAISNYLKFIERNDFLARFAGIQRETCDELQDLQRMGSNCPHAEQILEMVKESNSASNPSLSEFSVNNPQDFFRNALTSHRNMMLTRSQEIMGGSGSCGTFNFDQFQRSKLTSVGDRNFDPAVFLDSQAQASINRCGNQDLNCFVRAMAESKARHAGLGVNDESIGAARDLIISHISLSPLLRTMLSSKDSVRAFQSMRPIDLNGNETVDQYIERNRQAILAAAQRDIDQSCRNVSRDLKTALCTTSDNYAQNYTGDELRRELASLAQNRYGRNRSSDQSRNIIQIGMTCSLLADSRSHLDNENPRSSSMVIADRHIPALPFIENPPMGFGGVERLNPSDDQSDVQNYPDPWMRVARANCSTDNRSFAGSPCDTFSSFTSYSSYNDSCPRAPQPKYCSTGEDFLSIGFNPSSCGQDVFSSQSIAEILRSLDSESLRNYASPFRLRTPPYRPISLNFNSRTLGSVNVPGADNRSNNPTPTSGGETEVVSNSTPISSSGGGGGGGASSGSGSVGDVGERSIASRERTVSPTNSAVIDSPANNFFQATTPQTFSPQQAPRFVFNPSTRQSGAVNPEELSSQLGARTQEVISREREISREVNSFISNADIENVQDQQVQEVLQGLRSQIEALNNQNAELLDTLTSMQEERAAAVNPVANPQDPQVVEVEPIAAPAVQPQRRPVARQATLPPSNPWSQDQNDFASPSSFAPSATTSTPTQGAQITPVGPRVGAAGTGGSGSLGVRSNPVSDGVSRQPASISSPTFTDQTVDRVQLVLDFLDYVQDKPLYKNGSYLSPNNDSVSIDYNGSELVVSLDEISDPNIRSLVQERIMTQRIQITDLQRDKMYVELRQRLAQASNGL